MAKKEILVNPVKLVLRVSLAAQELKAPWASKENREKLVRSESREKLGPKGQRVFLGLLEQSEHLGFLDSRGQVESLARVVNQELWAKWDYQDLLVQPGKTEVLGKRVLKETTASMVCQEVGVPQENLVIKVLVEELVHLEYRVNAVIRANLEELEVLARSGTPVYRVLLGAWVH